MISSWNRSLSVTPDKHAKGEIADTLLVLSIKKDASSEPCQFLDVKSRQKVSNTI